MSGYFIWNSENEGWLQRIETPNSVEAIWQMELGYRFNDYEIGLIDKFFEGGTSIQIIIPSDDERRWREKFFRQLMDTYNKGQEMWAVPAYIHEDGDRRSFEPDFSRMDLLI